MALVLQKCVVACFGGPEHERTELAQRIAFNNRGWYTGKEPMERAFVQSSTKRCASLIVDREEMLLVLYKMLVEGVTSDKSPVLVLDEFEPSEVRFFAVLMDTQPFLIVDTRGLPPKHSQEDAFKNDTLAAEDPKQRGLKDSEGLHSGGLRSGGAQNLGQRILDLAPHSPVGVYTLGVYRISGNGFWI